MGNFFQSKQQDLSGLSIIDALENAKDELRCAYSNFENALEPDLIDCYIYQLQSAQLRYKFLLNCAKKADIKQEYYQNLTV